jgi:hypothetical protein
MFCTHTKIQPRWCTTNAVDSIVNQQLVYRYSVYLLCGKEHKLYISNSDVTGLLDFTVLLY